MKERILEVLGTTAPLLLAVVLLLATLVQAPAAMFLQFLLGAALVLVGLLFLFMGVDYGILPMGRFIGAELPRKKPVSLIVGVAFALGFATTIAEPDVLVLAGEADSVSAGRIPGGLVTYTVAAGVGLFVAIAMARVVYGVSMRLLLTIAYAAVIALSFVAPAEFAPLAYDAGSVTTGVLTAPVVISVALGLSSVLSGRSAVSDGFGLLGFASIGPIVAVMVLGIATR